MVRRWLSAAVPILASIVIGALARPAAAQTFSYLQVGNAAYSSDPFCLSSSAFLTNVMLGVSAPLFGVSAQFVNGDWPWPDPPPPPPPGGGTAFLTHGRAFQAQAEFNAVDLISSSVNQYVRPFVGVGIHVSTDGEAAAAAGSQGPTYGVKGQTKPYITYGLNGFLPIGSSRVGATAGYRANTVFFGDFEYVTPSGPAVTSDAATLTSGVWTVGLTLRFGN